MRTLAAPVIALILSAFAGAMPVVARAQDSGTTVLQNENVRLDFAQVMRVQPIYQVLRATRMEPRCHGDAEPAGTGVAKVVGAVRGAFGGKPAPAPAQGECEMVPVVREFRRPIAYDVDYVYRGTKYRSRLPFDPGNRLRVRVSVVPYIPPRASTP
ncbi:hypothetical protein LYSHEL_01270 [Lysobacter helvus]|uniref:Uncharacterized protein n=3 Tax=Lysobacterales TaxID=135614 RepID=A0ABM7Q1P6_9GAMM|nr:hypothetical protein LYSCAS_01270 [Lysobacter caseinilyticus]BCT94256.1 hypothetical protein LYSHEL_01270 [Lysobacter helvus]